MREREMKIAEEFGFLDLCKSFEADLLKIPDIVSDRGDNGIPFDLSGFLSEIYQVIIVPKYDIQGDRDDYWEARNTLKSNVVELAKQHDLHRSGDCIEDHGAHFYFVFSCGQSWEPEQRRATP
ncbi:MAG: hypothetical protein IJ364_05395 [Oscillospiraceae bacterium]|nr:hypothetical protein [Oscillospiraceae bacterium]